MYSKITRRPQSHNYPQWKLEVIDGLPVVGEDVEKVMVTCKQYAKLTESCAMNNVDAVELDGSIEDKSVEENYKGRVSQTNLEIIHRLVVAEKPKSDSFFLLRQ